MTELQIHRVATWIEIGSAVATFVALFFIAAPYGRHTRKGFGPSLPQRLGWVLMELPAVAAWAGIYALGVHALELAPLAMLCVWQLHYVHRTFVFPFRIQAKGKTTPVMIVVSAVVFNLLNAYVNARWVSELGSYGSAWLTSPQFIAGLGLFLLGLFVNISSDNVLIRLRREAKDGGYQIPSGGLYRWISCPNYFGEILEWAGWAILTWSLAGLAFTIFTIANLAPRAITHHRWYKERFPDYPPERRALIPFVV